MFIRIALKPELSDYLYNTCKHLLKYVYFLFLLLLLLLLLLFFPSHSTSSDLNCTYPVPSDVTLSICKWLSAFFVSSIQLSPVFDNFSCNKLFYPIASWFLWSRQYLFVLYFCCLFLLLSHLTNTNPVVFFQFSFAVYNIFCLPCSIKVFHYST